jgi:putative transposase
VGRVSEGTKAEKFGFIAEHQEQFGVRYLCRSLSVSPQGYYQWLSRAETARDTENRRVMEKIEEIYTQHKGNYGCPRVCEELKAQGYIISARP